MAKNEKGKRKEGNLKKSCRGRGESGMIEQLRSSLTQKYSKLLSRRLRCSSTEDHCYIVKKTKESVSPFHLRSVKSNQTSFLFSKVKTAEFLKKYPAVVYCFKNFQVIGGKLL